jgi:fatty acid synthase
MQTGESWNAPIIPKAYGALNLDAVSHDLPHLEQFVIFSSVVSSTGNEGEGVQHHALLLHATYPGILLHAHGIRHSRLPCTLRLMVQMMIRAMCAHATGQGNYGYANSVCDMLCMSRRAAGLPALAIAWGPVDHVGYVAEILKVPPLFMLPLCSTCSARRHTGLQMSARWKPRYE